MIIDKKGLEQLQNLKIKYSPDDFDIVSNYLFINLKKVIFISRYRNKLYHVCASTDCNFAFIDTQSVFNVIYSTDNLTLAVEKFHFLIKELINELY